MGVVLWRDTGPSYTLSELGRDQLEASLLKQPDSDVRRQAVRLGEIRTALLREIYVAAGGQIWVSVDPAAAGPIGQSLTPDELWGVLSWLSERTLVTLVGHQVMLIQPGLDAIERAEADPGQPASEGLAPLTLAVAIVVDSPGAQVMQNSAGGVQLSVTETPQPPAILEAVAAIRAQLDDLGANHRPLAEAHLAMLEAQAGASAPDRGAVMGAIGHLSGMARDTGSAVIAGVLLKLLGITP
jgi:hypothetical protein